MANPFDQFDQAQQNPFDQFDSDLVEAGIKKPQLPPDLSQAELARLPEDPAQFAASLPQPSSEWVQRQYDLREAMGRNVIEEFLGSAGAGVFNIARGLGLVGDMPTRAKQRYQATKDVSPITTTIGEIAGETAPFLIPAAKVGQIASLPVRAGAAGGLSGTEALLSARGRGEDLESQIGQGTAGALLGAGIEMAVPYVGRAIGSIYRRLTGKAPAGSVLDEAGRPTPEFQAELDSAGLDFDQMSQQALQELQALPPGASPEQSARIAQFAEEGIPYTRGDITQDLAQQATEARLVESASDPLADPFRQARLAQSQAIEGKLTETLEASGVPERTGEAIKEALSGRRKLLGEEKSALYKQATEQARELGGVPVVTDDIAAAVPLEDFQDLAITAPGAMQSLDGLLKRYGIIEGGEDVVPLTIENAERFRKSLNAIERGDQTGAVSVATTPIKRALDREMNIIAENVPDVPSFNEARGVVRQLKTEFSPQSIVGRLTDVKRDGVTPVIESSRVVQNLLGRGGKVEDLSRVVASLNKSPKGKQAIGDMQASAILQIMNEAFGAGTRKIDGVPTFGAGAFNKAIERIGKDKLNVLFRNNPQALKRIYNLEKIAKNIQPPGGAIPKGSASTILDIANKLGVIGVASKVPFGGVLVEMIQNASKSQQTRSSVLQAISAEPDQLRIAQELDTIYPNLARAMGLSGAAAISNEDQ